MLQTIRNAWRVEDIRKKLIFMMFIILIFRLGNAVTVPFVDTYLLSAFFQEARGTMFGFLNTMSGSALEQATIFALSIQPYINASIIMQLLTIAIPALERMRKEGGEEGKKKIERITRYATIGIAALQGFAYYTMISNHNDHLGGSMLMPGAEGIFPAIVIVATFMTGSALLMWMGEQITEFGIGNGISIILFVSIVARFPHEIGQMIQRTIADPSTWLIHVLVLLGALAIIVLIVIVQNSERRIPVQYSKRVVGRKMYGGQSTHLPMKVNMSGVLPIIFAQSIASIPATIVMFVPQWQEGRLLQILSMPGIQQDGTHSLGIPYMLVYFLLIVFFSYFYSTVQFNPVEIANNLKKNGGFIPGFRAGKPTSEFIQKVLTKITLFGAIYLAIVAISPMVIGAISPVAAAAGITMGGTSIIIVVSVALETIKQLESQMLMRHYKGFLE
ncbi:MAG: preprotein translocase subunit SecY [Oscillospiraceae bacterium]|nr:preprotein translocase subunit SecY [Oscillospiraceae bacterium]MCL2279150.1 preprotein translocase subunit SecY [Oscillospiraceae bacterium]